MTISIVRKPSSDTETFGELFNEDGSSLCYTIELPWLDNHPQKSCIPVGTYVANTYFSPHHGFNVWRLDAVPGRSEIEIHPANFASELLGCIGVGRSIGVIGDQNAVLDSKSAFLMLQSILPESFTLEIS